MDRNISATMNQEFDEVTELEKKVLDPINEYSIITTSTLTLSSCNKN